MTSNESLWCPNLTVHKDAFWTAVPQEATQASYDFYLRFCYDPQREVYDILPFADDGTEDLMDEDFDEDLEDDEGDEYDQEEDDPNVDDDADDDDPDDTCEGEEEDEEEEIDELLLFIANVTWDGDARIVPDGRVVTQILQENSHLVETMLDGHDLQGGEPPEKSRQAYATLVQKFSARQHSDDFLQWEMVEYIPIKPTVHPPLPDRSHWIPLDSIEDEEYNEEDWDEDNDPK